MRRWNSKITSVFSLLLFLLLDTRVLQAGEKGNGSVGVGNRVPLIQGLSAILPDRKYIQIQDNRIVDPLNGEQILVIDPVASPAERGPDRSKLVKSKLGGVSGWEYVPSTDAERGKVYWIVCLEKQKKREGSSSCLKITPTSRSNPKIGAVVGALTE